jgi:hypothetical protein
MRYSTADDFYGGDQDFSAALSVSILYVPAGYSIVDFC